MKTTFYNFYESTILGNIDFDGYEIETPTNECDKIKSVYKIFLSEYDWAIKNYGQKKAFAEWLSGLPSVLTVPFYYNEMIQNAQDFGLTINDEDIFCAEYFDKLADAFFTLYNNL